MICHLFLALRKFVYLKFKNGKKLIQLYVNLLKIGEKTILNLRNINKQIMTCNWREVPLNYFYGLCQKIFMNQNREKAFEI
jgi:hypothetical protein